MKTLSELRGELDQLDQNWIRLIGQRMAISEQIAAVKQKAGLPVLDTAREAQVIASRTAMAEGALTPDEVHTLMTAVMAMSRARQTQIQQAEATTNA